MLHNSDESGKERELNEIDYNFAWVFGVFGLCHCTYGMIICILHIDKVEVNCVLIKLQPGVKGRSRDKQHGSIGVEAF